ncbi:hypothetical protein [Nitrospira sp. Nam80]
MEYDGTSRPDSFTQGCRDFLRAFTYEDILAWTVYAAPLVFMIGPAAMAAHDPVMSIMLQSLIGFSISRMLHRIGHRLLVTLPNGPQRIYLSRSLYLPIRLTVSQFIWMLEILVGAAAFTGILGKRYIQAGDTAGIVTGLGLSLVALALFFVPVHLGRLWMERYDPTMTVVGPTEDVINRSFPGFRALFK